MLHDATNTDGADSEQERSYKECRTRHINAEFSNCLVNKEMRYKCNYAFLFGDGYLCTHPNHRNFDYGR